MKATFSQASGLHRTLSEGIYIQMMLLNDIDTCMYVLQTVNHSAGDLELSFKPEKYMSYLFNGDKHLRKGIPLWKGTTRLITEGGTKFLGKLIMLYLVPLHSK